MSTLYQLSSSLWTYDIQDKLNNGISSDLEKVNRKGSQVRMLLAAYAVDTMNPRAKVVAPVKIIRLKFENSRSKERLWRVVESSTEQVITSK